MMNNTYALQNLAQIEIVDDIKKIWANEPLGFTPWLADNLELLGSKLGMDLKLIEREKKVGDFSLDILAVDKKTAAPVGIENQFSDTDHDHLGKLVTYAAGISEDNLTTTMIWVAEKIREDHRRAVEWLNQISGEAARFFLVSISIVKIGESLPAPLFEVEVAPNLWEQGMKQMVPKMQSDPPVELRIDGGKNFKVPTWRAFFRDAVQVHANELENVSLGFISSESGKFLSPIEINAGDKIYYADAHGSAITLRNKISRLFNQLNKSKGYAQVECASGAVYDLPAY